MKEITSVGIAFSGTFFTDEFLQKFFYENLDDYEIKKAKTVEDLAVFYFRKMAVKKKVGDLFILDARTFKRAPMKGWFIGVHLKDMPENMSRKRFNIEVREILTKMHLIKNDAPADTVDFLFDTIDIENT